MGAFCHRIRGMSMSHILLLVLPTRSFRKHSQQTDDILERKHFSFPLEVVYMVQSLRRHIFSHQSFSSQLLFRCYFCCLCFFLPHGHFLYMFNWIILYVSCTKINVTHLSPTCTHKDLKIVYRAAWTTSFPRDEGKIHTPTHTQTDAMEQKRPIYTSVSVFIRVCVQMKSCLWSFCTESMKQAGY